MHGKNLTIKTMGKGDRRTRRGKIFKGSYGKYRPRKKKNKKKNTAQRQQA